MPAIEAFRELGIQLDAAILGQQRLTERMLISMLADGHLLLEGAPGLAKTRMVKELANLVEGSFHRVQFTPDLLPADLTGSDVYRPQDGSFHFESGPLFHHFVLADEINRAPAKVQSALLEAMAEGQITVGQKTHKLPQPFMVMATQNPLENVGTYPLPEAQLDRFLMHLYLDYPDIGVERAILDLVRNEARNPLTQNPNPVLSHQQLFTARNEVLDLHLAPELADYIVQLVVATRRPEQYVAELANTVRFGASPRGGIALERCARAKAWLAGRDYVSPEDIHALAADVLRHRVLLTYTAQAEGISSDDLISSLLQHIPIP
jgi:MoxR-like ATPase